MSWIVFSLIGTQIFAINYFFDKHISTNLVKDYHGMPIYGAIVGLIIGTVFWVITGFPVLPLLDTIMLIAAGMLTIFAAIFYYAILAEVDASLAVLLNRMESIFVLILSVLILKQNITIVQLIGFFTILISVGLLSFFGKKMKFNGLRLKTFFKFVLCNFMWAAGGILVNLALHATQFTHILSYESWGLGLGGILMFIAIPSIRKGFLKGINGRGLKTYPVIFFNELLFVSGKASYFYAFSLGPAALVSIVGSTQVLSAILYGIVLTIILPKMFKEDISKRNILWKSFWAVVIIFGLILIQ